MTPAGERIMPLQPAFLAYNSANDPNKTGNATNATVEFDTEVFDQGGDYDNTTDTFTAPITGRYDLYATLTLSNITAAAVAVTLRITTSNRVYFISSGENRNSSQRQTLHGNYLADMDQGDTAIVIGYVNGEGADTVGFYGSASLHTCFSGHLAC